MKIRSKGRKNLLFQPKFIDIFFRDPLWFTCPSHLIHLRIILNPKIVDDKPLALHGILAHVVF